VARQIDQFMTGEKDACASEEVRSTDPDNEAVRGTISIRCRFVAEIDPQSDIKNAMIAWNTAATLYDFAAEFPKGYGYALFADGTAGGSVVDVDVVKAAFNGKTPKAELDPDRLKEIWGSGAK
jgi:hypothetical protein